MFDELPPKVRGWFRVFAWLLIAFVVLAILGGLLLSIFDSETRNPGGLEARTGVSGLTAALKGYYTEYGKWPDFTDDGLFLDEGRNAQLVRLLCGSDERNNPRKIIFYEGKTATRRERFSGRYAGGFHPKTGAFLDPWGNPYRIAVDARNDEQIANPYSDDGPPIRAHVIVWSLGKDGKQGSPANPHTFKGSDDVTSWQ